MSQRNVPKSTLNCLVARRSQITSLRGYARLGEEKVSLGGFADRAD